MIKRFISTVSLLCLAFGIHADSKYLTVEKKNGSMISFLLEEKPVITFESGSLVVNKSETTTYSIEDIKNYHFTEGDLTPVDNTVANALRIVWIGENTVELQNAESGTNIELVAVNGTIVAKATADSEGKAAIKVPNKAGVYVLSTGKQSFKIISK